MTTELNQNQMIAQKSGYRARYVVLVPEGLINLSNFAYKIHAMAMQARRDVVFVALARNMEEHSAAIRQLATISAITQDVWFNNETRFVDEKNWQQAVQKVAQEGDIVICHLEQIETRPFSKPQRISDFIRNTLKLQVVVFSGFWPTSEPQNREKLLTILFWLGCLLILAGFSFLEIQIDRAAPGVLGRVMMILVVAIEMGLIWVWNTIAGY